ncbi:MAG: glycosyltransferase [Candidatus Methanomethylicaceae archaeon]
MPYDIFVVSLKYAPVFKTHSFAFGEEAGRRLNCRVHYLFSRRYAWLISSDDVRGKVHYMTISDNTLSQLWDTVCFLLGGWIRFFFIFAQYKPYLLFFSNPHLLNPFVTMLARCVNAQTLIISHIHEPVTYPKVRTLTRSIYDRIAAAIQIWMFHLSTDIVLSSQYALEVFKANYPAYRGRIHLVPLLFEDYACTAPLPREYISYVGAVHQHRGIFLFLNLVRYAVQSGVDLRFQVVTKDDLSKYVKGLQARERAMLKVINKKYISDSEISEALRRSFACLVLYDYDAKQSGVIPVAYMNGTPVIATRLGGLPESVADGETGFLVSPTCSVQELLGLVQELRRRHEDMSPFCRSFFERTYHMQNWSKYYAWLPPILACMVDRT